MPTALLSVYNKDGIVEFAHELMNMGWQILASGGTAKALQAGDIPVRDVADIIGGGAMLDHRVVTLSREIHLGLLAEPHQAEEVTRQGIPIIDLVCVDLYPLEDATRMVAATMEMVLAKTDIGGPALLRSAAKGNRIVICEKTDREHVLQWLRDGQPDRDTTINTLAAKAEKKVAAYCLESARFRSKEHYDGFIGTVARDCSYGENRWQSPAALLKTVSDDPLAVHRFALIEGNNPSYTNWRDLDRLLQTTTHIAAAMDTNLGDVPHIAVGVKHGNPCGAATGADPLQTVKQMVLGNPQALFGGVVMTNFPVTGEVAHILRHAGTDSKRILDGVAAPSFDDEAVQTLKRKDGRCRLYRNDALADINTTSLDTAPLLMPVRGGFLRQPNYTFVLNLKDPHFIISAARLPNTSDVLLAWAVGATSNSNTITLVKENMVIGNGVGQTDRVGACELALNLAKRSGHDPLGAVAYSDSFFPFTDGVEVLADAGIAAIVATSGSKKDSKVRVRCAERGVAFLQIPDALGRGFFGH